MRPMYYVCVCINRYRDQTVEESVYVCMYYYSYYVDVLELSILCFVITSCINGNKVDICVKIRVEENL